MEWRVILTRAKPRMYIFAFVFFIFFELSICDEVNKTCFGTMKTAGFTIPHGDIIIEKGGTLDINCTLHESYMCEHNITSDDLYFITRNEVLSKDWVKKINESTIRLYIENMPPSDDMYTCATHKGGVCMNKVMVDAKPTDVLKFTCLSYNYENLTCTWIAPKYYVNTTFNLSYHFPGRNNRRAIYGCPNTTRKDNKYLCFWDLSTTPQYRQTQPYYYFNLNISNVFGKHTQKILFNHFEYVIPAPPENLSVLNKTSNSVTLSWSVRPPMKNFPSNVIHRLVYQSEFDSKDVWHVANTSIIDLNNTPVYTLSDLKYAHVLYDIRISMRSSKANEHDEKLWSKNVSLTVRTESTVPGAPPELNIGSFGIENNNLTQRDIYVYWKSIPEHLKNGENFSYKIIEIDRNIKPSDITNTYAKFENMSQNMHRFQVLSANEVGRSVNSSMIVVPSLMDSLPEPNMFTKIFYGNQVYELSWNPPKTNRTITSYTIFYCRNEFDRPFPCKGYLEWVEVDGNTTLKNITVAEDRIYQFAISANSGNTSSGMVWASCTVIHDKEFTKMKKLWIDNIGSTFIDVSWKLDCSDRIGSIEGFIIYYCPIVSPFEIACYGEERNVTISGESSSGRIENLKPYTTYMLTVSVKLKHNSKGLPSDPLYNTTLEAKPEPPQNVTVTDITSTSIRVSWSQPRAMNGVLRYYQVEVHRLHDGERKYAKPSNEKNTTVELTNLDSFTAYSIQVYAHTVYDSEPSQAINVTTAITVPSRMRSPNIKFQNESTILVAWNQPEVAGGRLDKYQLRVKEKINFENHTKYINTSDLQLEVDNCGTDKALKVLYFSVRAINYDDMKREYVGDWSTETENYCQASPRILIWIFIALGVIFIVFIFFGLKKVWHRCQKMRDVEVKLPPGLATIPNDVVLNHWPNTQKSSSNDNNLNTLSRADSSADEEHLLGKKAELGDHERIPSGDSSGCSSGHESVTSSLASGTNLSSTSDSGTEQPRTPNSDSMSRENSLRQRKTGSEQNWEPELTWMQSDFVISKPGKTTLSPPGSWTAPKVPTSNYCVLGVDNVIQQPQQSDLTAATATPTSGYVAVPLANTPADTQCPTKITTPPYVTCDTIFPKVAAEKQPQTQLQQQSPAYVKTSDAALLSRPAHIQHQTPAAKQAIVAAIAEPQQQPLEVTSAAVGTAPNTPSYVMAGAPAKTRFFGGSGSGGGGGGKTTEDFIAAPSTGKLINIEPLTDVNSYMQHSSEKDHQTAGKNYDQASELPSSGYVKTEDILGLKAATTQLENRANRSRRGSDETPTSGAHLQPQQASQEATYPYCRLGWDKNAGVVDSASVPTTPVLKKPPLKKIVEPSAITTKGYVPHRQFENKSLKED